MVFDGANAGRPGAGGRGEWTVANLQLDDILALGLEGLGNRENVKSGFCVEAFGKRAMVNRLGHELRVIKLGAQIEVRRGGLAIPIAWRRSSEPAAGRRPG